MHDYYSDDLDFEDEFSREVRLEERQIMHDAMEAHLPEHVRWYNARVRDIEQRITDIDRENHTLIMECSPKSSKYKRRVAQSRTIGEQKRSMTRELERDYVDHLKSSLSKTDITDDERSELERALVSAEETVRNHAQLDNE